MRVGEETVSTVHRKGCFVMSVEGRQQDDDGRQGSNRCIERDSLFSK